MEEENMVANEATEAATADDMLSDEIVEEAEEPAESLDSLMGDDGEDKPAEEQEPERKGTNEPGYVQKRIDKALAKQKETIREELMSEISAQMEAKYAPIMERLLEMDAKELVRKGEVKDIELAKELLRYRQGQPAPQAQPKETAEQPRQADGRFAPKQDAVTSARIDMLALQVDRIKDRTGIDVMAEFNANEEIKEKVMSGEMDFYDVAELMKQGGSGKRKPPAPTRSSNGASGQSPNAIENMTKEQFARMEKKIAEGARYSLR
jgi:hypothetical protein